MLGEIAGAAHAAGIGQGIRRADEINAESEERNAKKNAMLKGFLGRKNKLISST